MVKVKYKRTADCVVGGEVTRKLEKLIEPPGFTGRAPGGPSRWSTRRSSEWKPLVGVRPLRRSRFFNGTRLVRRRAGKAPRRWTLEQVDRERKSPLGLL